MAAFVKATKLHGAANAASASGSVSATAGNTLIVATNIYYQGSAVTTTLTVTGAGTWTSDARNNQHFSGSNDNFAEGFASNPNTTGGTFTLTVAWGGGMGTSNTAVTVYLLEFSGMPTSGIFDSGTTPTGSQGASSPVTSPSVTNNSVADLMLAIGSTYSAGAETHGSPTNSWTMPTNGDETDGTQFVTGMTAYKLVSASASQSTSWTVSPSVAWTSFIAAYKTAAATTFPISRSVTQSQSLSVAPARTLRRTTSASQGQALSIALAPSVTLPLSRSVAQAQLASLSYRASIKYLLGGTASQGTSLSLGQVQARLPVNYYTTSFPLTENPINEGNVWSLGGVDGLDWHNPRSTVGRVFGTQPGTDNPPYTDSIGVLKGTWGANQEVTANLFGVAPPVSGAAYYAEVELLLRFTITPHSTTGYEVTISVNSLNNYIQINRWTGGAFNNSSSYVQIASTNRTVGAGDVMSATINGSTITVYQNGTQILQTTDTTVTTGKPGIGFFNWDTGAHVDPTTFGFSRFTAHTIGTPWPLGGSVLQGQALGLAKQAQIRRTLPEPLLVSLAKQSRLSRVLAAATAVSLVLPSRLVPITRAITQAQAASTTLVRGVIVRVLNASQGQSARLEQRVRLLRALSQPQQAVIQVHTASGGTIYGRNVTVAAPTRASMQWSVIPLPPGPSAPDAPELVPDTVPDTRAPQLSRRPSGGAPPLLPYRPSGSR